MPDLLQSIRAVGEAADRLIRACAHEGALADSTASAPMVSVLRRSFRTASVTPSDMLATLRRAK